MKLHKTRVIAVVFLPIVLALVGSAPAVDSPAAQGPFASAQQVEFFRGQSFVLGNDSSVAVVRALDWSEDRSIKIPFWLGTGNATPPASQPKQGGYYVILFQFVFIL